MKKILKILKALLLLFLALLICVLTVWGWIRLSTSGQFVLKAGQEAPLNTGDPSPYDMIAVLGCGVYPNGSLSPLLRYRMERTLELYEKGYAPKIVVSGDHREGEYDEVDHMAEYLTEHGVPGESIVRDYEGFSTYESMWNLKTDAGGEKLLLVTQKYHLYRALFIGNRLGLEVSGAAAQDWPMSAGTLYRHLREIPACIKDWLMCQGIDVSRLMDKLESIV